jgi:hypothetical protein
MDDFKTHVHSNGLPTERSAFNKASLRSDSIKSRILVELEDVGGTGLTPDEFVFKHGGLINTIRRRFTDLWKDGKIKHHPTLLTRKNTAGNDCVTWVLGRDLEITPRLPKRQWVGLTDEERIDILVDAAHTKWDDQEIIKAIEAKLKEKNSA